MTVTITITITATATATATGTATATATANANAVSVLTAAGFVSTHNFRRQALRLVLLVKAMPHLHSITCAFRGHKFLLLPACSRYYPTTAATAATAAVTATTATAATISLLPFLAMTLACWTCSRTGAPPCSCRYRLQKCVSCRKNLRTGSVVFC
jgi:hypothetical protein